MASRLDNALGLIGQTPLVALTRLHPGPGTILAKAEFLQPGGSIKDRAARKIIERARARGDLQPGQPVVEMTSGNMGAGLAVVCAVLGHELVVTMSAGNSPARARMLEALGATVILVPQVDGQPGQVTGADIAAATDEARRIAATRGAYYVDQFNNPGSVDAHETGTGPEIWDACDGRLDGFVACVGSGGTFVGVASHLKRVCPGIVCAAVEPEGCEPLGGRPITKPRHLLQGTGYGVVPMQWRPDLMDLSIPVTDEEAAACRRDLAVREGLHVGFSAAANVAAARILLGSGRLGPDARVATILCDTGLKY